MIVSGNSRRLVLLASIVVMVAFSSGCWFNNVFYGFRIQGDYEVGVWTETLCYTFPNSDFELRTGKYQLSGGLQNESGGEQYPFPASLRGRLIFRDAANTIVGRVARTAWVNSATGGFAKRFRLPARATAGGSVCYSVMPRGEHTLHEGQEIGVNLYIRD